MKKKKYSTYENIMAEIVGIVGDAFDEGKLEYCEAIGVFSSAQHIFVKAVDKKFNKGNENDN